MIHRFPPLLLVILLVPLAGCAGSAAVDRGPRRLPDDPTRPYVVTAIDYHFHDAHPSRLLAPDREVIISNQGSNVHNVTFEGTTFVRDIRPGERLSLGPIGDLLTEPGRYRFACKYHLDRGMKGVLVVGGP
jgi:cupredoxin-like protein